MADIIYKEESYKITGACFEVYKEKGCGFHEPVYHECLGIEFGLQGIPAISSHALNWITKAGSWNKDFSRILCVSVRSSSSLRRFRISPRSMTRKS